MYVYIWLLFFSSHWMRKTPIFLTVLPRFTYLIAWSMFTKLSPSRSAWEGPWWEYIPVKSLEFSLVTYLIDFCSIWTLFCFPATRPHEVLYVVVFDQPFLGGLTLMWVVVVFTVSIYVSHGGVVDVRFVLFYCL